MGGEQKSVLLIDDEPFFLVMGQDLLEEKGYRVITAQSGREGLEKARTWLWLPSGSEANRGDRPWTKKNRLFFSD